MTVPKLTGRKYSIAKLCIGTGFALCALGIAAITWKDPTPGAHIASIVGNYANILMVSVSSFAVADATITSVAKWKDGAQSQVEETTTTTSIKKGNASPPGEPVPVTVIPSTDPLPVSVVQPES